jgi:DNA polymerase-3 subunit gamma/tau
MAYQVLARKWRPQDFSTVVGQEPIVTALRNALQDGRVAQAYLFSGIRGVGKTSVARVLAKALNCENGPAADPCNNCNTCSEITSGADLDVIEVDAATYSKVEQVRELTESLKYGPARDRYKVVVIDEIHRLSRQAFDALLKIVEEPPPHLVFIFATTEIDAVPATILSRCQEFHFRRVRPATLTEHLRKMADDEGIEVGDAALRMLSRAGEGSVRDAVALLDQMATFGSGKIADAEAARILGGVDSAVRQQLLEAILRGQSSKVSALVNEIEQEGWDPRHVYREFLVFCRDALHLALDVPEEEVDLPHEDTERLKALAKEVGYENLLRLLHHLLNSEIAVRRSEAGLLALEIAWLRAAELPKLTRIETLLGGGNLPDLPAASPVEPGGTTPPPSVEPAAPESTPQDNPPEAPALTASDEPEPLVGRPAPSTVSAPDETPDKGTTGTDKEVREFLALVSQRKQPLAAHLEEAERLAYSDDELAIYHRPDDTWLSNALARKSNRSILDECSKAVWGEAIRWRLRESGPTDKPAMNHDTEPDPVLAHPTVQTALDIFGGTAHAGGREEGKTS